jgi:flagellar L-ring protein FlgH
MRRSIRSRSLRFARSLAQRRSIRRLLAAALLAGLPMLAAGAAAQTTPAVASVQTEGSLWRDSSALLFAQRKATQIGDLVTVVIVEDASASNKSQLQLTKENKTDLSGEGSGKLSFLPIFGGTLDYKKDQQGKGQTTLSGQMSARVTAEVIEILPDGNYLIEGSRSVKINDDLDRITVRGVVRPEDIRADNSVLSTYLAQAQIAYVGSGPGKNAARQGLISRILDLLF